MGVKYEQRRKEEGRRCGGEVEVGRRWRSVVMKWRYGGEQMEEEASINSCRWHRQQRRAALRIIAAKPSGAPRITSRISSSSCSRGTISGNSADTACAALAAAATRMAASAPALLRNSKQLPPALQQRHRRRWRSRRHSSSMACWQRLVLRLLLRSRRNRRRQSDIGNQQCVAWHRRQRGKEIISMAYGKAAAKSAWHQKSGISSNQAAANSEEKIIRQEGNR